MPRKPDRWEREADKRIKQLNMNKYTAGLRCGGCLEGPEVIKLLRKEHAWMVRMVKLKEKNNTNTGDFYDGYIAACIEILNQLTQRRK